jgi:hypothetical protein
LPVSVFCDRACYTFITHPAAGIRQRLFISKIIFVEREKKGGAKNLLSIYEFATINIMEDLEKLTSHDLFARVAWMFFIFGIISLFSLSTFMVPTISLWLHGIRTTGTIVGLTQTGLKTSASSIIWREVQFADAAGNSHTVLIQSFAPNVVRQTMAIYYDPSNPNNAASANILVFGEMFLFSLLTLALLGLGGYFFKRARAGS